MHKARVDHVAGGIYRISIWAPEAGLTFNQFLIDDDAPTLIHTGRYDDYDAVVAAVEHVLDPARLANSDGDVMALGEHQLRFLETPHVHHWDSMMVFEERTRSLFPSDLYLQPGERPAITSEDLSAEMIEAYRTFGIFAHEDPGRAVDRRIEKLRPEWVHTMHGASIARAALPRYSHALQQEDFAYRGVLFGRPIGEPRTGSRGGR